MMATPSGSTDAAEQKKEPAKLPSDIKYSVRYEGNNSKRWDGKEILIDGEWLEDLYNPEDLVVGKEVLLPWAGKRGKVVEWKGILVGPKSSKFVYSVLAQLAARLGLSIVGTFMIHFLQTKDL